MCVVFLTTYWLDDKWYYGYFGAGFLFLKLVAFVACTTLCRYCFKLYESIWRYANFVVYTKILVSDLLSGIIFFILGRIFPFLHIGVINVAILTMQLMIATIGSRLFYQFYYAHEHIKTDKKKIKGNVDKRLNKVSIAIVGAGNVGASLATELARNPRSAYVPYCFIDKDKSKIGCTINGVPILAEGQESLDRLKEQFITTVVIAIPDASAEEKKKLYSFYSQAGCHVKLYDYLQTSDTKPTLRNFTIEDVLFRDAINLNFQIS